MPHEEPQRRPLRGCSRSLPPPPEPPPEPTPTPTPTPSGTTAFLPARARPAHLPAASAHSARHRPAPQARSGRGLPGAVGAARGRRGPWAGRWARRGAGESPRAASEAGGERNEAGPRLRLPLARQFPRSGRGAALSPFRTLRPPSDEGEEAGAGPQPALDPQRPHHGGGCPTFI